MGGEAIIVGTLEQIAHAAKGWGSAREAERQRCVARLEAIAAAMEEAASVWSEALSAAPEGGDRFTPVLWIGAERARRLHRIHAKARELGGELTAITGVALKDSMGIVEEIDIVDAYRQLQPGESGADRARAALDTLAQRKTRVLATARAVAAGAEAVA